MELGLDRIYIQAKRYSLDNKVGSSAIRDFFGSLDRFKAAKGVFVTTSDFTKDATDTVDLLSKRIILINGIRLSELMVRHNVGCRVEETLQVKKIIEDFDKLNIKSIDYLACNSLKYSKWNSYYNKIHMLTNGVRIGASANKTGNNKYGGDWMLESTGENVESIYFTNGIVNCLQGLKGTAIFFVKINICY